LFNTRHLNIIIQQREIVF